MIQSNILTGYKISVIMIKNVKEELLLSNNIDMHMQIMQDNLCELRKIAGWTAEKLANKLGTTKQSVSNIETQKVKLTRMQYIAIRAIFECEISIQKDNPALRKLIWLLFENPINVYIKHSAEIRTALISIAAIASAGISGIQLYSSTVNLLSPLGHIFSSPLTNSTVPSLNWLVDLMEETTNDYEFTEDEVNEES